MKDNSSTESPTDSSYKNLSIPIWLSATLPALLLLPIIITIISDGAFDNTIIGTILYGLTTLIFAFPILPIFCLIIEIAKIKDIRQLPPAIKRKFKIINTVGIIINTALAILFTLFWIIFLATPFIWKLYP